MKFEPNLINHSPGAGMFLFKTNSVQVHKVKYIRRVRYKDDYVWALPDTYPDAIIGLSSLKGAVPGVKATKEAIEKIEALKRVPEKVAAAEVIRSLNLPLKATPFAHQYSAAEAMLHYKRLALILEQGMGKTFTTLMALMAMRELAGRDIKAIVLVPVIVRGSWAREAQKMSNLRPLLYQGDINTRKSLRDKISKGDWDILITNYETLSPQTKLITKTGVLTWWLALTDDQRLSLLTKYKSRGYLKEIPTDIVAVAKSKRTALGCTSAYATKTWAVLKQVPSGALFSRGIMDAQRELDDLNYLLSIPFDVGIMDEGSRVKGHQSKRSLATKKLMGKLGRKYILSGTLCLGDPQDVYMPMTILSEDIFGPNFKQFQKRYVVFGNPYNKHAITGFKNIEEMKLQMEPYVIVRNREDCLDLPDRLIQTAEYTPTEQQVDLYNQIINEESVEVSGHTIDVSLVVQKITKLRQVLSGFIILPQSRDNDECSSCARLVECVETDTYRWNPECMLYTDNPVAAPKQEVAEIPCAKLELLKEKLKANTDKCIIWAYFRYDLKVIEEMLKSEGFSYITASEEDCDIKFETGDYKVFLGQESQGIGITLNAAKSMYYYSHGLSLEHRLQSMDRNYRIGQKEKVLIQDFVCPDSIEENIVQLLQHKQDVKAFIQSKAECLLCNRSLECCDSDYLSCRYRLDLEKAETKHSLHIKELTYG